LQLARLVESRVSRNFYERRLTRAVFLDVAKAFDTVWAKGLLYKLTLLNVPHFTAACSKKTSFQSAISTRRSMGLVWPRVDLSPLCHSVCDLSIGNGVPLYEQQIRPLMDGLCMLDLKIHCSQIGSGAASDAIQGAETP
jgi:hypothetical protein